MATRFISPRCLFLLLIAFLVACAPATTPAVSKTDVQNTAVAILQTNVAHTQTALPTATPYTASTATIPATPTLGLQPFTPFTMPDAIQVERWREYQTELARALFAFTPKFPERPKKHDPDDYKGAICEWDILGRSRQEMYVWAVCGPGGTGDLNPAVIYLDANGFIQSVKVFGTVGHLHDLPIYDLDPFPMEVQEKLCLYYLGFTANSQCGDQSNTDRPYILLSHLKYRQAHPDEPPLVILSVMATATP